MLDRKSLFSGLEQLSIVIASASYYCVTDSGEYSPAEIGIVRFSFGMGIMEEYHVIIKRKFIAFIYFFFFFFFVYYFLKYVHCL